jgi:AcrR family transcriptional regulator
LLSTSDGVAAKTSRVRTPVQERSKQTYNKILTAASELITEVGFDTFTTNAVAERADVNIASLYAYFNDKYDILTELVSRHEERRTKVALERMALLGQQPWPEWIDGTIDRLFELRLEEPDGIALRRAIRASARLAELDRDVLTGAMLRARGFLQSVKPEISTERAEAAMKVMFGGTTEILDQACLSQPEPDLVLIAELKLMMRAYFGALLES